MARIELNNVCFEYPLYEVAARSLKVTLMQQFRSGANAAPSVKALRNITLSISDGERFGLIGANGAGKSSLLRIIGGLAHATSGNVRIDGRIVPLISQGVGINSELSAAENIELPLRLLGAISAEIASARQDVRDFADLGPFFDLPVRRFSDGMRARLSFALSTAISADVLVLDEWLSAGDARFVQRAEERLKGFLDKIKVVVIASHSLELLRHVCTRVAWLDQGELVRVGPAGEVIDAYLAECALGSKEPAAEIAAE